MQRYEFDNYLRISMNRFKNIDRSSVWLFLVITTACSFPWSERINSVGIVLLVLHWLFDKNLIQKIKSIKFDWIFIASISFFLFHIVALIWSSYKAESGHSIETKIAFAIIPILFSTENYLNPKSKKQLFLAFIISCSLSFIYCLGYSIYHFHSLGMNAIINRMNISLGIMHPGYYSNYFALGIVVFTLDLVKNKHNSTKWFNVSIIIFFSIIAIVLASKTALIFIFVFAINILWKLSSFIKNNALRISTFLVVIISFSLIASQISPIQNRILEAKQESNVKILNPHFVNSTIARRAAWSLEWELVKHKPIIGYGTGSANPLLLQKFKENNYSDLLFNNMHTHNQLLHTWIDLGLMGIVILLSFLGICLANFIQQKEEIGVWFSGLVFINILTDDMLEIQAGIVFFVFFLLILIYQNKNKFIPSYS